MRWGLYLRPKGIEGWYNIKIEACSTNSKYRVYTLNAHFSAATALTPGRAPLTETMKTKVMSECDAGRVNARDMLITIHASFPNQPLPNKSVVQGFISRYRHEFLFQSDSLEALSGSIRSMGFDTFDFGSGDREKAFYFTKDFQEDNVNNETARIIPEAEMLEMFGDGEDESPFFIGLTSWELMFNLVRARGLP
jgi:hypothetical protein